MLNIRPGQIPSGTTSDELISTLDIFPTLLAAAGAKIPENLDGSFFNVYFFFVLNLLQGVNALPMLLSGGSLNVVRCCQYSLGFERATSKQSHFFLALLWGKCYRKLLYSNGIKQNNTSDTNRQPDTKG